MKNVKLNIDFFFFHKTSRPVAAGLTNGKRKAENGSDARSKCRGCLQTMPCKKEKKPAQQG